MKKGGRRGIIEVIGERVVLYWVEVDKSGY